jgi:hypothetical protein
MGLFMLGIMRSFAVERLNVPSKVWLPIHTAARFNGKLVVYLTIYLAIAGLTAGYTLISPGMCWLLYVALARLVRQHQYLAHWRRYQAPFSGVVAQGVERANVPVAVQA